jgi:virginiamycin B lyase
MKKMDEKNPSADKHRTRSLKTWVTSLKALERTILPLALTMLIILFTLNLPKAGAAAITEYNLPPGSTKPYGLASDGTYIWAAEYGSDKIARLTQDSAVLYEFYLPTGSRPYDIAWEMGEHSRVWFTESSAHKIGVISKWGVENYNLTEYKLEGEAGPRGIAIQLYYPDGSSLNKPRVWFTEYSKGAIGALYMNYTDGPKVVEWFLPDSNCGPLSIVYLNSTGVWFTEYEAHRIGNFNPATKELKEWPLKPGSFPWGIANDTYGNLWFTMSGRNRIGKLNPYTNEITEYLIPTPNSQPYGITVDKYNNVWFAEHAANKLVRFTPGSNVFVEFERAVGGAPFDVIWEEGSVEVWFTDEGGNRIGRLDPTKAITTMTVSTITTAVTESSTATTIGSSTATKTDTKAADTASYAYYTTLKPTTNQSYVTTTSTTQYSASETSRILVTSLGITSTTNVTVTGTTTVISTSYTKTVTGTTSLTATQSKTETATIQTKTTSIYITYISTITTSFTVSTISYVMVTVTSYTFASGPGVQQIPGYTNTSIGLGLLLGAFAILFTPLLRRSGKLKLLRSHGFLAVILLSTLILAFTAQPTHAATITEWTLPSGSTIPYGITYDDQSPYRVWFAEFGSDKIGRLNHLSGEIWEVKVPSGSKPWGIAFEKARHELWFTMSGRDRVGVVSGYGGGSLKEIRLTGADYGIGPLGIAVQEHVNGTDYPYIWVAHYGAHAIIRLDPYSSGKSTTWSLGDNVNPQSIIYVKETGVWFTDVGGKKIGNLNPLTGEVKYWTLPTGSGTPWSLAADSLGYIWFTEDGVNHASRLNPYSGELMRYRMPSSASQPYGIAVDALNNVWIADHGLNRITRFSPDDLTFTELQRTTGGLAWGLTITPEGWIWFTDEAGNKIGRIDTTVNTIALTTSSMATASKTTTTLPAASETKISEIRIPATVEPPTTITTAPTTVTTTYGLTETVWILQTSLTQTVTAYSTTTLIALGEYTTYQPTTVATETLTNYETKTSTSITYQTVSSVSISMSPIYSPVTTITNTTTTVTTINIPWGGASPIAAITAGLVIGAMALIAISRARKPRWRG